MTLMEVLVCKWGLSILIVVAVIHMAFYIFDGLVGGEIRDYLELIIISFVLLLLYISLIVYITISTKKMPGRFKIRRKYSQ